MPMVVGNGPESARTDPPSSSVPTLITVRQALACLIVLLAVQYLAVGATRLVLDQELRSDHAVKDVDESP